MSLTIGGTGGFETNTNGSGLDMDQLNLLLDERFNALSGDINSRFTGLTDQFTGLNDRFGSVSANVSALGDRMGGFETSLGSTAEFLGGLPEYFKGGFDSLAQGIAKTNQRINSLDLDGFETRLLDRLASSTNNDNDFAALTEQLTAIQDNMPGQPDLSSITDQLTAIQNNMPGEPDLSSITDQLTNIEDLIGSNNLPAIDPGGDNSYENVGGGAGPGGEPGPTEPVIPNIFQGGFYNPGGSDFGLPWNPGAINFPGYNDGGEGNPWEGGGRPGDNNGWIPGGVGDPGGGGQHGGWNPGGGWWVPGGGGGGGNGGGGNDGYTPPPVDYNRYGRDGGERQLFNQVNILEASRPQADPVSMANPGSGNVDEMLRRMGLVG